MMRVWKSPSRGLHALDSLWPALVLSVVVGLGGYTLGATTATPGAPAAAPAPPASPTSTPPRPARPRRPAR